MPCKSCNPARNLSATTKPIARIIVDLIMNIHLATPPLATSPQTTRVSDIQVGCDLGISATMTLAVGSLPASKLVVCLRGLTLIAIPSNQPRGGGRLICQQSAAELGWEPGLESGRENTSEFFSLPIHACAEMCDSKGTSQHNKQNHLQRRTCRRWAGHCTGPVPDTGGQA
jgi:hypothetical protein